MTAEKPGAAGLRETLLDLARDPEKAEELARVLAEILPGYTSGPLAGKYFRLWEEHGVHVTPVHFYQPIPDTRSLPDALWEKPSQMPGIAMNEAKQLELLCDVFPRFRAEYDELPAEPTSDPREFYLKNGAFEGTDALVLYCMVRSFRPSLVLEVGSGFSSRVSARAALVNGNTRVVCIEPYPDDVLTGGFPGLTSVIPKKVQEVDLEFFGQLAEGDILFIDSSHVVKTGGDVTYLFLEVLPRLRPGVIVHVHDIFLPQEFPKRWILDLRLFWTEQYLLQAFLAHNSEFEILFANAYMGLRHQPEMRRTFPKSEWWGGGSFWFRRKPDGGERTIAAG
jgi:Methyltransferase domain